MVFFLYRFFDDIHTQIPALFDGQHNGKKKVTKSWAQKKNQRQNAMQCEFCIQQNQLVLVNYVNYWCIRVNDKSENWHDRTNSLYCFV